MIRQGLIILLSATVWGCTQGDSGINATIGEPTVVGSATVTFVLEETYDIGEDVGDIALSEITWAAGDSVGNLYVYDFRSNQLAGFGSDGAVSWVNASRGSAPGEIKGIWGIAIDSNSDLVASNQNMSRIDRFTSDGVYLSSVNPVDVGVGRALLIGFLDSGDIVLAKSMFGKFGVEIIVAGAQKELLLRQSFSLDQTGNTEIPDDMAFVPTTSTSNGYIIVGNLRSYEYTMFTSDGSPYRKLTREDVEMTPPLLFGSELGISRQNLSRMEPLLHITDNFWLGGGSWPTKPIKPGESGRSPTNGPVRGAIDKTRVIDLFNVEDENLIASFSATSLGIKRLLAAGGDGVIYAELDDDAPSIGRFRVEIEAARHGQVN